jgi:hypothetical protein
MKIGSILAKVGSAVLKNAIPGAGMIIDTVNAFLPADKKLPGNATGAQAIKAINDLPPEAQADVLSKQLDVDIAEINSFTQVQEAHAIADGPGSSTRPAIAKSMSRVIAFTIILYVSMWSIAVFKSDTGTLNVLNDSYLMLLAMIGTPVAVVLQYFGKRTKEKTDRYHLAHGQQAPLGGIASVIRTFIK